MNDIESKLESSNKEFYEINARDYEKFQYYFKNTSDQRSWSEEIGTMVSSLNGKIEVLEVGAGTGNLTLKYLENENCSVTAFDISDEMVSIIKEKSQSLPNKKINVFQSSISDFFKDTNEYDIVCESSVLHHVDDYLDTIKSMASCVRPDGFLYITREPINVGEISSSGRVSNLMHKAIEFSTGKIIKLLKPFGFMNWHISPPDHSVIAHHAYKEGVIMKNIIHLAEEMGFELFSFRKYNWRQISLISHLENRVFEKLRKDEFRRTFCSLIMRKKSNHG